MAKLSESLPVGKSGWEPILGQNVFTRNLEEGEQAKFDEGGAISLVVQDYNRARAYLDTEAYLLQWEENDVLYQSPTLGTEDPTRARVARFTVNNQSNTMADACRNGLFAQKPPFFLRPRGGTTQGNADAWTALIDVLLDRMKFRYWVGLGIDSMSLHGTGVWKGGWSTRKRIVKKRVPKAKPVQINQPAGNAEKINTVVSDDFDIVPETIEESFPWIEKRMLGTTLFDPAWRTPNAPELCGYAIDYDYPTWSDLERMRDEDCYDIPNSEALKQYCFHRADQDAGQGTTVESSLSHGGSPVQHAEARSVATTANVLEQPMLMLERWDESTVKTVLHINDAWVLIRDEEHGLGRIPHFASNWRNIENTGYGMGHGKLVGGDQRVEQGTLNHALNLLAYQFNPAILVSQGSGAPNQNRMVRAGGYFPVSPLGGDVRKSMAVMEMPAVPAEAWKMIQYAKSSSEETSGADSTFQQGNLGGPGSSAARTATGANRIAAKSDGRVQTPVENIELGLFNPFITMLIDMVKTYMPMKEIRQILSTKLQEDIMRDFDGDAFISADLEVEMLAAAKLAAKAAMAQQLPFLMQIFQQPQLLEQLHAEGKTVDLDVILDVLFAVSEFRMEEEIIRNLTPEEMQRVQSVQNPKVGQTQAETQGKLAIEAVKGENQTALEDRRAQNELARDVTMHALEHHTGAQEDPGERAQNRNDSGIPLSHSFGLALRAGDEDTFEGKGASPLAGVS